MKQTWHVNFHVLTAIKIALYSHTNQDDLGETNSVSDIEHPNNCTLSGEKMSAHLTLFLWDLLVYLLHDSFILHLQNTINILPLILARSVNVQKQHYKFFLLFVFFILLESRMPCFILVSHMVNKESKIISMRNNLKIKGEAGAGAGRGIGNPI